MFTFGINSALSLLVLQIEYSRRSGPIHIFRHHSVKGHGIDYVGLCMVNMAFPSTMKTPSTTSAISLSIHDKNANSSANTKSLPHDVKHTNRIGYSQSQI